MDSTLLMGWYYRIKENGVGGRGSLWSDVTYARYSKRAKTGRERKLLICILAFSPERKDLSKIHELNTEKSLR